MSKKKDHNLITELEAEVEEWLSEFSIEYPDEEKIDQTIAKLHPYVPEKKQSWILRLIPAPWRNAFQESLNVSSTFWMTNLVYLAIGMVFVLFIGRNPYMTLFLLAPLPVLIGLVEIFRSRDEGMIELELSLKYSPSNLMLSKLAIIGVFNFACNLLLIIVFNVFAESIVLINLLKYWAAPYLLIIAICLFLSIKIRAVFAAPISVAILFTLGLTVSQFEGIYQAVPNLFIIVVLIGAAIMIGLETKMIKEGVYHEFNN